MFRCTSKETLRHTHTQKQTYIDTHTHPPQNWSSHDVSCKQVHESAYLHAKSWHTSTSLFPSITSCSFDISSLSSLLLVSGVPCLSITISACLVAFSRSCKVCSILCKSSSEMLLAGLSAGPSWSTEKDALNSRKVSKMLS